MSSPEAFLADACDHPDDIGRALRLRELRLYCTQITAAGIVALANRPALVNLRSLLFDHHVVNQQAAEALADSRTWGACWN